MADIIMQASSQGVASRSRGIAGLGAGLAGGMREIRQREEEDKKWQVKKRFMNAQADAQETAAAAGKKKLDDAIKLDSNLKYASENNLSDADTEQYLLKNGSAAQAGDWRSGKEANDSAMLAQEATRLTKITALSKVLQNNFASAENEVQFDQAVQYTKGQTGKDPAEGMTGTWEEKQKIIMGGVKTIQEKTEMERAKMQTKDLTDMEKKIGAYNRALKSGDPLAIDLTGKDVESQGRKTTAIANIKEMDEKVKQKELHGPYSDEADTMLADHLGGMDFSKDAMPKDFHVVTEELIRQKKDGRSEAWSKQWLKTYVQPVTDESWVPFTNMFDGPTTLKISEHASTTTKEGDVGSLTRERGESPVGGSMGAAVATDSSGKEVFQKDGKYVYADGSEYKG